MVNIENFDRKFNSIGRTNEWKELQRKFNDAEHIFLFGHGGNLGVADHAAIDISRLTDKNVIAPGSGVIATSIISDESFETTITEVNRGGAVCLVEGLKAFLPGSHFLGVPDEGVIGNTVKVKFLDVNEEEGKVVVSQRRAMMDAQNVDLKKGEVVQGTVTGLRNYGAFLELDGGVAGLLHISHISFILSELYLNIFGK